VPGDAFQRLWTPHRLHSISKGRSAAPRDECPFCVAPSMVEGARRGTRKDLLRAAPAFPLQR
jgi:hypothetical protein